MPKYLLQSLDRFSPKLCRLLARKRGGRVPLSYAEISEISGLSSSTVVRISHRTTWRGMRVETVQRFSLACGVNLAAADSNHVHFIRHHMRAMLKNANPNQRKMLRRLIAELHADHK